MTEQNTSEPRDIYTVTRLVREVRDALEYSFPPLWVQGEISNLARPASGHLYFSLKDRSSQVRCAMFKNRNRYLKFEPDNGMAVVLKAKASLYEGRGEFQLVVETLEPEGVGALQLAFEQLKQKLMEAGLFAEEHKKPIPLYPRTIGVITSRTGAAIRDIIHVLTRRYPLATTIIYPVSVQGAGSAEMVESAIRAANSRNECDVLILARGGGSLEDLWSFNEERVARAIYESTIPVVTGIGHEIDFTIADFVADRRAPTPSAAAELVSPDINRIRETLAGHEITIARSMTRTLAGFRDRIENARKGLRDPARTILNSIQRVDELSLRLARATSASISNRRGTLMKYYAAIQTLNPLTRLRVYREKNHHYSHTLRTAILNRLKTSRNYLERLSGALHTVSPLATLDRGYSIMTDSISGKIIKAINHVTPGVETSTQVTNGKIYSKVTRTEKK